jgi:uncharacterized protein YjdB
MMTRYLVTAAAIIGLALSLACSKSTTSPSTVSSVAVTGTAPAVGATSQFTAMATMSDGTTQDVSATATWASSNTAGATVSATGAVTGVSAGTVQIQATYQTVAGTDAITIGS